MHAVKVVLLVALALLGAVLALIGAGLVAHGWRDWAGGCIGLDCLGWFLGWYVLAAAALCALVFRAVRRWLPPRSTTLTRHAGH